MEELNKNQIVLLVLLVSFVTSIATGIVTVTLLDQAPPAVTQTINRIVERTVEKVVPRETQVSTVIKEIPVIVTEEALIVKAINEGAKAIARIVSATDEVKFVGSGFLTDGGLMITVEPLPIDTASSSPIGAVKAILADGRNFNLKRLSTAESNFGVIIFKATGADDDQNGLPSLKFSSSTPMIGQTVIALGAANRAGLSVAVGIISSFLSSGTTTPPLMMTNAVSAENIGGPILNIKGEVIGLNYNQGLALSLEAIRAALDALPK